MGTFNAATAVEALGFDFTAFGGSAGVIPEPSTDQVNMFLKTIRNVAVTINPEATDTEAIEAMKNITEEQANAMGDTLKQSMVDLCSGAFPIEDLNRLPYRVFAAFSGWLAGSLRPEVSTSGTNR